MESPTLLTREQAIREFTDLREGFARLARDHTREQLLWQPDGGAWSIGECLEHVALANAVYLANMRPAISRAPVVRPAGDRVEIGGWFSGLLLKSVSPGAKRKLQAPKKLRPLRAEPSEALGKLAATYDELVSMLEMKTQPDLNRVRFQNPFIPLIRFTVASGILILAAHGRRHLLQAERISEMPGFPRAPR